MPNSEFEQKRSEMAVRVEKALDASLPEQEGFYKVLIDAMRYSLLSGGKRIRAILVLAFARLFGLEEERAMPAACAVEMVHAYSLIHDDLPCMDDDDFRRGKPSCHKKFGEATALLAGDALLTSSFGTLIAGCREQGIEAEKVNKAGLLLSELAGTHGMVGGQMIDLLSERQKIGEEILFSMQEKKTAALIRAAVMMGSVLAGASETQLQYAGEYAGNLGLAFQVIDDILDVTADEALLGKPIGSDKEKEKSTSVSLYGLQGAKELAQHLTCRAIENLDLLHPNDPFLYEFTAFLLNRNQ